MTTELDVRLAVRQANRLFRQFPVDLCLPLLAAGATGEIYNLWFGSPSHVRLTAQFLISSAVMIGSSCLGWFAEMVTATIYLQSQNGVSPNIAQVREAAGFPGFASLVVRMFLRILGWTFVAALFTIVSLRLIVIAAGLLHVTVSGSTPQGLARYSLLDSALLSISVIVVLSRFVFVFPQFALERGGGSGLLARSVSKAKRVWKVAILITFLQLLPFVALPAALGPRRHPGEMAMRVGITLVAYVISRCFAAWLVVARTSMVLQMENRETQAKSGNEAVLSGEPSPA